MTLSVRFSERVGRGGSSPISYMMEQGVANPGIISLAAGLVDQESLPVEEVGGCVDRVLGEPRRGQRALQYGTTDGDLEIRQRLVEHLASLEGCLPRDLALSPDRLIVGTGSQQLLYLVGEILLDPGDIVLLGVPTYFVYMGALESLGARIVPIPTDDEGMLPDALDEALAKIEQARELERVKFIYDVSYFNNPTGLCLSARRRQAIVDLAWRWSKTQRIFVVEDAAYRELRYRGEDIPSMLRFDAKGETVLYAGTFSKPFAPGLKTGYLVTPPSLRNALIQQKGHHDFGSSNFVQHLLAEALTSGDYHRHLGMLRELYREKLEVTLSAIEAQFAPLGERVQWTEPDGGLYVWVRLPPSIPTSTNGDFFSRCLAAGVLVVPGEYCYPQSMPNVPRSYFRLSFGFQTIPKIEEGVARLGKVLREML
ncbi:MAG: PLP-dependent aminotransferase family protein [Planctomycetota bacterium]